eukprot:8840684-Alexandrium_andersonii.AAC.1
MHVPRCEALGVELGRAVTACVGFAAVISLVCSGFVLIRHSDWSRSCFQFRAQEALIVATRRWLAGHGKSQERVAWIPLWSFRMSAFESRDRGVADFAVC